MGGGANLVRDAYSRRGYVSKNLYVKMKESGPLGGRALDEPRLNPPMVNGTSVLDLGESINAVADPGFPVGGAHLVGGANSQSGYVS